jgi:hypothetical protein
MMAKKKAHGRTASGKPITDELVKDLADKAEAGYDLSAACSRAAPARRGALPETGEVV